MPRSGGRWGSTPCGGERTFVRSVCCIVARTERADGVKLVSSPPFGCSPLFRTFRYHSLEAVAQTTERAVRRFEEDLGLRIEFKSHHGAGG